MTLSQSTADNLLCISYVRPTNNRMLAGALEFFFSLALLQARLFSLASFEV